MKSWLIAYFPLEVYNGIKFRCVVVSDAFGYVPDGKAAVKWTGLTISVPFGADFCLPRKGGRSMENRLAVISIIIEDTTVVAEVNELLHNYGQYIVGRMGIPYRDRGVSIICIVMD